MSELEGFNLESVFQSYSKEEIQARLDGLEVDLANSDDEAVYHAIKKVLLFQIEGFGVSAFTSGMRQYKKGGRLYRARKLDAITNKIEGSDFWEAPKRFITEYGRLNKPHQQLLYASTDALTPLKEVHLQDDVPFLLTAYDIVEDLEVLEVGMKIEGMEGVAKSVREKLSVIDAFLSRHFFNTSENAYKVSSVLANKIFKLGRDGWCYPSVANAGGVNLCLNLASKTRLKVACSFIGGLVEGKPKFWSALLVGNSGRICLFQDWNQTPSIAKNIHDKIFCKPSSVEVAVGQAQSFDPVDFPLIIIE
ncbi:RES family NAD+ phosphorylase [Pseudomonas sp. NPDC087804]|uniref:RES family NAD+ phosphorylase n=1 Tax=Pseudomonas sp. NPDC087804 TaxID=3364449 RepID=UPI00382F1CAB